MEEGESQHSPGGKHVNSGMEGMLEYPEASEQRVDETIRPSIRLYERTDIYLVPPPGLLRPAPGPSPTPSYPH